MTDTRTHLSEDVRQMLAERADDSERDGATDAHLARCAACAADVERLRAFMSRTREAPAPGAPLEELWPSIRARIVENKVVALDAPMPARRVAPRGLTRWALGLAAAALLVVAGVARSRRAVSESSSVARTAERGAAIMVADSAGSYEQEARILLNRLELRRSMMRPEAVASMDRDLSVIDQAIDELKLAIANDPTNGALRQLLASSYRQKIDLLRRVDDAS